MKKRAKGKMAHQRTGPVCWAIVLLDQEPLRKKTASDCQREMEKLEVAKEEWRRFEQEDRPAFARWMALTFGPLQSELRELKTALHEKEGLVLEVETEMAIAGWPNYEAAYQALQRRREMAMSASGTFHFKSGPKEETKEREEEQEESPREEEPEPEPEETQEFSEVEEELMFEMYVSEFLGMDPDKLSDAAYRKMYAEFRENILKKGARPPEALMASAAPEPASRLKEIYRLLARRLHPDMRADDHGPVSDLWHEVQEAYSQGNIERLEMLLALTDIQAETTGEHTTLGQMKAALKELRRSFQALMRSISRAKKEMAWDFSQQGARPELEQRIRTQMERDRAHFRQQLEELEAFIESWTAPRRQRRERQRSDSPY